MCNLDESDAVQIQIGANTIRFGADIEFDGIEVSKKYLTEHKEIVAQVMAAQDPVEVEKLMVEFGGAIVDSIGDEVDRIEAEIQKQVPEAKHVDLEPQ